MHQSFNRHSIRLRGYDYSQEGLYFITINCQDRAHRFGKIVNGQMLLNDAGRQAQICWLAIPEHFTNVVLHEFVVMPNHVHGIIEINAPAVGANHHLPLYDINLSNGIRANHDLPLRHGTSQTIGSMVRGFKIGVTKWFITNYNIKNIWQRNYYEHIIRDENAYQNISNYIENNPLNSQKDKFHH
ncbi:transposase [Pedobacter xixiisoli]|uniref:REP element-mobilizing transposase RayT n=1 Tax=Pedobacter xixiisoli TaxID=1476464 RepID=A0A286AA82_9SPHI|nr:transposase [Pedobacter xixiisoli]SOD18826.1 REP element-mobilizing transposase RayT [Pedobacter xixiisoli]